MRRTGKGRRSRLTLYTGTVTREGSAEQACRVGHTGDAEGREKQEVRFKAAQGLGV